MIHAWMPYPEASARELWARHGDVTDLDNAFPGDLGRHEGGDTDVISTTIYDCIEKMEAIIAQAWEEAFA